MEKFEHFQKHLLRERVGGQAVDETHLDGHGGSPAGALDQKARDLRFPFGKENDRLTVPKRPVNACAHCGRPRVKRYSPTISRDRGPGNRNLLLAQEADQRSVAVFHSKRVRRRPPAHGVEQIRRIYPQWDATGQFPNLSWIAARSDPELEVRLSLDRGQPDRQFDLTLARRNSFREVHVEFGPDGDREAGGQLHELGAQADRFELGRVDEQRQRHGAVPEVPIRLRKISARENPNGAPERFCKPSSAYGQNDNQH
jgi:hypothetical protein